MPMAIKTDIIDRSHDIITQIITDKLFHNVQTITETWIEEDILSSTIKFYNEIPENLNIDYDEFLKDVWDEIEFITKTLEIPIFDNKEIFMYLLNRRYINIF